MSKILQLLQELLLFFFHTDILQSSPTSLGSTFSLWVNEVRLVVQLFASSFHRWQHLLLCPKVPRCVRPPAVVHACLH